MEVSRQATRRVEERAGAREQQSTLTAKTMGYKHKKRQALLFINHGLKNSEVRTG
jgi:hypothetical protein